MDSDSETAAGAAGAAVAGVDVALSSLVEVLSGGELGRFDAVGLVELMREFERVRNRLSLVDHRLVFRV